MLVVLAVAAWRLAPGTVPSDMCPVPHAMQPTSQAWIPCASEDQCERRVLLEGGRGARKGKERRGGGGGEVRRGGRANAIHVAAEDRACTKAMAWLMGGALVQSAANAVLLTITVVHCAVCAAWPLHNKLHK